MKKGISFYFGFHLKHEESAKMIKEAGFDYVITNADKTFDKQNGTIRKQMKLFKKYGLKVSSLHMRYKTEDLHYFWKEGKEGEKLVKNLIKDIKVAHHYGFSCVVVHLFGEYSEIGEKRLRYVLDKAQQYDVPLAIENIDCPPLFKEVFEKIKHPYMKFCYDSGHNHVFDPDCDYLNLYGDKLVALHLHENMGDNDSHTVSKYGNINWSEIANGLKDKDIVLDYEMLLVKKGDLTPEECLKETMQMANDLEKMIEEIKEKESKKLAVKKLNKKMQDDIVLKN